MVLTDTQDDEELSRDHCAIAEIINSTDSTSGFCLSSSTSRSPVLLHESDEETDDFHMRMLDDEKNYFEYPIDSPDMDVGMTMDMDGHLQNSTQNPSQNLAPVILNSAFDASADLDDEELLSPALSLPNRRSLFLDTSGNETGSAVTTHSYSSSEMDLDLDFELDTDIFSDLDLARNTDEHLASAPYSCVHDNHHPELGSTLGSSTNAPRASTHPAPFDDLDTDMDMDIMDMLHVPPPPPGLDPTGFDSTHIICDFGLGLDEGQDNLDVELDIDSDYSDYSYHSFDLEFDDLHSNGATPVPLSLPELTQTRAYATETSLALPVSPRMERGGMVDDTGLGLKLFSDNMELLYDDDKEQEQTQSHSISRISSSLDSVPGACNNEHPLFSYSSASPPTPSFRSSSGRPTRSPLQQRQDLDQWHPLDADDSDDEEDSFIRAKADMDLDLIFFELDTAPVTPMLKLLETNLDTNLGTGTNRNTNSQLFSKLGSDSKAHLEVFFSSSSDSNYLVEIDAVDCQKPMDGADNDNIDILS